MIADREQDNFVLLCVLHYVKYRRPARVEIKTSKSDFVVWLGVDGFEQVSSFEGSANRIDYEAKGGEDLVNCRNEGLHWDVKDVREISVMELPCMIAWPMRVVKIGNERLNTMNHIWWISSLVVVHGTPKFDIDSPVGENIL